MEYLFAIYELNKDYVWTLVPFEDGCDYTRKTKEATKYYEKLCKAKPASYLQLVRSAVPKPDKKAKYRELGGNVSAQESA